MLLNKVNHKRFWRKMRKLVGSGHGAGPHSMNACGWQEHETVIKCCGTGPGWARVAFAPSRRLSHLVFPVIDLFLGSCLGYCHLCQSISFLVFSVTATMFPFFLWNALDILGSQRAVLAGLVLAAHGRGANCQYQWWWTSLFWSFSWRGVLFFYWSTYP